MSNSNNQGLVVVAHGSKLEVSNDEIRLMVESLKEQDESNSWIAEAFLEFGNPTIPGTLMDAHLKGIKTLKIFPYFTTAGVHVNRDLTAIIEQARKEYPDMTITLLPHLGSLASLPKIIHDSL